LVYAEGEKKELEKEVCCGNELELNVNPRFREVEEGG
jgi:hypothetical protein